MINDIKEILLSEEEIGGIVERIANEINNDYKDKKLLLVCILKGSVCLMSDLMKKITLPCAIDFMVAKSYYAGTESKGDIKIYKDLDVDITNYDVLIIEDIFDSGRTLNLLVKELAKRNPRSLECCTLLDKPERRDPDISLSPKYVGKNVPDEFVVGYGLDYDEAYRNLPFVGVLKREVYDK